MADNITLNTMSGGSVVAADDVASVWYQRIKLTDGTADSTTPINVDIGVKANALRVAPASDITDATYIGDIKFGESLPAGTAEIGKLAANSGVDIGDVTINNASGASAVNIQDGGNAITVDWAGTAPPIGAGLEATALRVTVATDSTGVLSIDDNGGSLTVDNGGTFAVQSTLQAGTAEIGKLAAGVAEIGNVKNSGTFVVQENGASLTSLQIIDDWDNVHDAVIGTDGALIIGEAIETDGTVPGTAVAEGDATRLKAGRDGVLLVNQTHPYNWSVSADYAAAQTNTTVKAAPGAGLKLYITDILISNGATAGNITLLDGSGGTVLFEIYPAVNGGATTNLRTPIVLTANTLLAITSTTVTTHSVTVSGYIGA